MGMLALWKSLRLDRFLERPRKISLRPGFTVPGLMSLPFLIPYFVLSRNFSFSQPLQLLYLVLVVFVALASLRNFLILSTISSLLIYVLWGSMVRSRLYVLSIFMGVPLLFFALVMFLPLNIVDMFIENFGASNNEVRRLQSEALLSSFEQAPYFGIGVGMPLTDLTRSIVSPWSYELSYHAILAQRGAVGFIGASLILSVPLLLQAVRVKFGRRDFFSGYFCFSVLLLANATNPYFGRFDAIFLLLLGLFVPQGRGAQ